MLHKLPFEPFPFLGNSHLQTILSSILGCWSIEPPSQQKLIPLNDGDHLSLEITTPKNWQPTDKTVVLFHGLCGSHRSPYLVRIAKRLRNLNVRAVRVNMRGCGSGKGHAKQFYHSGRSEDALAVIHALKKEHPNSPIHLIGYSLGANLVLKLAGELEINGSHLLSQVVAVSPPADLYAAVKMFDHPANSIYERHFFRALRLHVRQLLKEKCPLLPKKLKVIEFDEMMTAPHCGFTSAIDYYTKCSSAPLVPKIRIPCKILFAEDDPFIPHSCLDHLEIPSNVQIYKTNKGGHLGYLGTPFGGQKIRWLDSLIAKWVLVNNSQNS